MKKLLQMITAVTILGGTGLTTVACNNNKTEDTKNVENKKILEENFTSLNSKLNEIKVELQELENKLSEAVRNGTETKEKIAELKTLIQAKIKIFNQLKAEHKKLTEIVNQYEKDAKTHLGGLDELINNIKEITRSYNEENKLFL